MTGVLRGIKVVDMGHVVAVPAAGAMMADWGAEVIKVEPLSGETLRGVARFNGVETVKKLDGGQVHWWVQLLNRNKRGLAIDSKQEAARNILYRLIKTSDVFMSNYERGSLKKLGLDYGTLSQLNPGLVYAVLTGYGTAGPDKDERGFDFSAAWARAGLQYLLGEPGSAPPPQRPGFMDAVTSGHMVAGILGALLHRERTGQGQELEFSLYHSAVWTLSADIQASLMGTLFSRSDRTTAENPLWNTYRTRDDRWLQLVMLQSDLLWPGFCRAVGRPGLEQDPMFRDMEARRKHCRELIAILDETFGSRDIAEWEQRLKANSCIYGRIQSPTEVVTDPQALANGFFASLQHPAAPGFSVVTTPVKFLQDPASVRTPAPETGEHAEEILLELGYTWEDIAGFKEQRVIL